MSTRYIDRQTDLYRGHNNDNRYGNNQGYPWYENYFFSDSQIRIEETKIFSEILFFSNTIVEFNECHLSCRRIICEGKTKILFSKTNSFPEQIKPVIIILNGETELFVESKFRPLALSLQEGKLIFNQEVLEAPFFKIFGRPTFDLQIEFRNENEIKNYLLDIITYDRDLSTDNFTLVPPSNEKKHYELRFNDLKVGSLYLRVISNPIALELEKASEKIVVPTIPSYWSENLPSSLKHSWDQRCRYCHVKGHLETNAITSKLTFHFKEFKVDGKIYAHAIRTPLEVERMKVSELDVTGLTGTINFLRVEKIYGQWSKTFTVSVAYLPQGLEDYSNPYQIRRLIVGSGVTTSPRFSQTKTINLIQTLEGKILHLQTLYNTSYHWFSGKEDLRILEKEIRKNFSLSSQTSLDFVFGNRKINSSVPLKNGILYCLSPENGTVYSRIMIRRLDVWLLIFIYTLTLNYFLHLNLWT